MIRQVVWFLLALAVASPAQAQIPQGSSAELLRVKHRSLRLALQDTEFGRPIRIESSDDGTSVSGDVFAVLDFPFESTSDALSLPANWCDVLLLHFNVKFCQVIERDVRSQLDVAIGRKFDQPLSKAYRVDFDYNLRAHDSAFLHVRLFSDTGPLRTSDYTIVLQAVPLGNEQTFLHFSYSYVYGTIGKLAMKAYLNTLGRNKIGFSQDGVESNGQVRYIRGMRGAVERNAMRYFLAIEAFLGTMSFPDQERWEPRLESWFDAVQRYPRQLYEMDREEYLEMKHKEIQRQDAERLRSASALP